ncbi:MAG: DUF1566 domain-containing protein, partial [Calditrichae bacterium]|nr:DUF1566 domain-containing protein [Calditrichia bacterium]
MLLAYIPDLIEDKDVKNRDYRNSFEIYEKMVDAWMKREEGILENTSIANLQEFSERLAVDLYTKSEQRSAARIHHEELEPLAQRWEIDLNKFQISSRSLLNRDALGYYKFAHRTFMEFLFMQRFLKWDPQTLKSPWNAQIQTFFKEAILLLRERGELLPFSLQGVKIDENEIKEPVKLRATPLNPFEEAQVAEMIKKENFFDIHKNKTGKGFIHDYQIYIKKGEKVVIDYRTNLMWQQSGSQEPDYYKKAQTYIKHLNDSKFAGYDNWRLPTLEEAMSLMEREKKNADLYIDPMFDTKQRYIWTADRYSASGAWNVVFDLGYCNHIGVDILDI